MIAQFPRHLVSLLALASQPGHLRGSGLAGDVDVRQMSVPARAAIAVDHAEERVANLLQRALPTFAVRRGQFESFSQDETDPWLFEAQQVTSWEMALKEHE